MVDRVVPESGDFFRKDIVHLSYVEGLPLLSMLYDWVVIADAASLEGFASLVLFFVCPDFAG